MSEPFEYALPTLTDDPDHPGHQHYPIVPQRMVCMGFCGWETSPDEGGWSALLFHLLTCPIGHAVYTLAKALVFATVQAVGEDPAEYYGAKSELYSLSDEDQATELIYRFYIGKPAIDSQYWGTP